MEMIVKDKNKNEEKIVQAFLNSLQIEYYTEIEEDKALYKAKIMGRKTRHLSEKEKEDFIKSLKKRE